ADEVASGHPPPPESLASIERENPGGEGRTSSGCVSGCPPDVVGGSRRRAYGPCLGSSCATTTLPTSAGPPPSRGGASTAPCAARRRRRPASSAGTRSGGTPRRPTGKPPWGSSRTTCPSAPRWCAWRTSPPRERRHPPDHCRDDRHDSR